MGPKKYLLEFLRAPGDVLLMTALVRDLKLTYGDGIQLDVVAPRGLDGRPYPDLWRNNPYLTDLSRKDKGVKVIDLHRGPRSADGLALSASQRGSRRHYITGFHKAFSEKTKLPVELLFAKPDLHLSDEEKATPLVGGDYWIIAPGYKTDITNKAWLMSRWKEVVFKLRNHGYSFIQEGAAKRDHINTPIEGATNLIDATNIRDFARNIYHSQGIICLCSLGMHLAAALEKPCVVIFGGREEPSHEWYQQDRHAFGPKALLPQVPHRLLHTFGELPCCLRRGCWLRRVQPLGDNAGPRRGRRYDESLCKMPDLLTDPNQVVPQCMSMITVDQVVEAVLSYKSHNNASA
jgi:ADP-heptose:LPS heptosyltransferase